MMLTKAYKIMHGEETNGNAKPFGDSDIICDYVQVTVKVVRDHKLIDGFEDASFQPLKTATRAK